MKLNITNAKRVKKVESRKNKLKIVCIDVKDTNNLNKNKYLYIDLMNIISIKIFVTRIKLFATKKKRIMQIIYKNRDVMQPTNFPCKQ